jgi:hypothetical protein
MFLHIKKALNVEPKTYLQEHSSYYNNVLIVLLTQSDEASLASDAVNVVVLCLAPVKSAINHGQQRTFHQVKSLHLPLLACQDHIWEEDRNGEGVPRVYWRQAERIVLFLLLAVDD